MTVERKWMETGITLKRKQVREKKKVLNKIRSDKKNDLPVAEGIENILLQYNISAAAYHGGKLNGVDCQELIHLS
jgi:hypothetical protein